MQETAVLVEASGYAVNRYVFVEIRESLQPKV